MIIDEAVRGHVPPLWFWALPGIERIRAFSLSQLPAPPLSRLLGIRPAHVGPGSGTWTMPATWWSQLASGELEISMLAEAAMSGVAMTTLSPGMDVTPITLDLNYFRPARAQAGNLLARARVVNASRFFLFAEVEIEDPQGRQIVQGASQCQIRQVDPSPPPPPPQLQAADDAAYATPDPYLRPARPELGPPGRPDEHDWLSVLRGHAEGRFVQPFSELTGCRIEEVGEQQLTMSMPATEWLCCFSREVAPGAVAAFANYVSRAAGWTSVGAGQSFVGLSQAVWLYRPIQADGRIMRAQASGTGRYRDFATAEVNVYDADGRLCASGRGIAQIIDATKRQKRPATEAKRVLATLLFSDIVGSTQHAQRLGDARWHALLAEHRNAVRAEILRCEGVEVDTAGDGFFVRFDSPAHALECARALCDGVKRLGVEVRVGVHTGECELQGRTLTGIAVHIAARIQALAEAGEILVSGTVKDLAVGSGARFEDRGEHALKGVPGEWRLYALTGS